MQPINYEARKTYFKYLSLLQMLENRLGYETITFLTLEAPTHIEKVPLPVVKIDDKGNVSGKVQIIEKLVYDFPKTMVRQALINYSNGRKFWDNGITPSKESI